MKFKTAYSEHVITGTDQTGEESLTEQSHKKECEINNILKKYQRTGVIEHRNEHQGQYADIPSISFREAQEVIATASSMFEELPSSARKKFNNDPETFLQFVQDERNHQEMYDMGLSNSAPEPAQRLAESVLVPPSGDTATAENLPGSSLEENLQAK